jgi:hypothetical protein
MLGDRLFTDIPRVMYLLQSRASKCVLGYAENPKLGAMMLSQGHTSCLEQ